MNYWKADYLIIKKASTSDICDLCFKLLCHDLWQEIRSFGSVHVSTFDVKHSSEFNIFFDTN